MTEVPGAWSGTSCIFSGMKQKIGVKGYALIQAGLFIVLIILVILMFYCL